MNQLGFGVGLQRNLYAWHTYLLLPRLIALGFSDNLVLPFYLFLPSFSTICFVPL